MLGLGLVGGSVARATVSAGWTVRAWTPSGVGPRLAAADGIDPATDMGTAIAGADVVVLAAPPLACLQLLDRLAREDKDSLGADAVVTDVASTKAMIGARAESLGLRFVGGHPLAGRETSGYAAADPKMFVDRPWVIVPPSTDDTAAEDRVTALARACGARPIRMTAVAHDAAVAAISHLPLVLAAALTEATADSPDWESARSLAAGGWSSATRLARGDVEMGTGILSTNAEEVVSRLRAIVTVLEGWAIDLDRRDADRIRARLAAARAVLELGDPDVEIGSSSVAAAAAAAATSPGGSDGRSDDESGQRSDDETGGPPRG